MLQGNIRGMKKGEQSLGFIAQKKENLSSITSFLLSFKMNSWPACVCPSLVVSVGLTDLPSLLCFYPPISMVKSLQDVCVSKPYCCLKGRQWRRKGARAWQPGYVSSC